MTSKKRIIGRAEFVEFPDYELTVPAKVDTGADRNSVHATRVKIIERDGEEILKCKLLKGPTAEFKDFSVVQVKSSNGQVQKRFKVRFVIEVLGKRYKTSFSLTNRQNMKYPILLGKNFLRNRFLVDVSLKNISLAV